MFKDKFMQEVIDTFHPPEEVLWLVEFAYNVGHMSGKIEQMEESSATLYGSMVKSNSDHKH